MRGRRRSLTPRYIMVTTAMLWLCTAIAAAAFWPVYQSERFVIMVAVTTVVASAIAVLGALYRAPAHLIALSGLVAYLVLGVPLAVPGQAAYGVLPTLPGLADLALGTAFGWKQLLTITLPVGAFQALLVPAFILVLVTVLVGLSVALRAANRELGVLGPLVLYLAAIVLGSTSAFWPVATSLAFAAAILLWLVFFRWHRRRVRTRHGVVAGLPRPAEDTVGKGLRTVASATVVLFIAGGGAVAAAAVAPPTGAREVLRSAIVQPFDPRAYASPLSGFRGYHQEESADETMLTVAGLPAGARLRIATLDTYDGVVYGVGGDTDSFRLVPYVFDQSAVSGESVEIDVTVGDYSGVWLPTVGQFESIRFTGADAQALRGSFYYNDESGSAAVLETLGSGDAYRLTAVIPDAPSGTGLATATPGSTRLPALPALPEELTVALGRYVADADGDGARLQAAIAGLRAEGYVSHGVGDDARASRSGHSTDRINELFSGRQMIGDEEQYAVAGALLARSLGFPARAVVGFAPDDDGDTTGSAGGADAGTTVVTGSDISAWIEVDTAQFGWVAIDTTPELRDIPEQPPEEPAQVARPQSPVQPPEVEDPQETDQPAPETSQDEAAATDPLLAALLLALRIGGWVLLAVAVLISPFVAIVAAKWHRRRRRQRARSPLDRVTGGWREVVDSAVDHGLVAEGASTRGEYARQIGSAPALALAEEADRAVFAPVEASAADATRAWAAVESVRVSLETGLTRWQRLKVRVSPRSLRASRTGDAGIRSGGTGPVPAARQSGGSE